MIDTTCDSARAPKSFHHGDLRRALIEAANDILAEDGLEGLTLRKLAQRIGVSHAAPYHHFADKAAVLAAVADAGFGQLTRAMQAASAAADPDPFARLAASGTAYVEFALQHPGYFSVMFRPDLSRRPVASIDDGSEASFEHLINVMNECLGDGAPIEVRDNLVLTAWSVVHGAAELLVHGPLGRKPVLLSVPTAALPNRIPAMLATLIRNMVAAGLTDPAGQAWRAAADENKTA